jgi:ABC-type antimicrobial peptide transport system permease subunit
MGAVWLSLGADFRLRWRPLAALALLLGLIGGVVLTAAAGARRTDTAYPRLLQWARAAQVDVLPGTNGPVPPGYFAAVARLPQVSAMSVYSLYQTALPARHGPLPTAVMSYSSTDRVMRDPTDQVKILQGRMFGPQAVDQAVVDPQLAALEHLRPGSTLHLLVVPNDPRTGGPELRRAIPVVFRVSAVGVFDTQIVPAIAMNTEPIALLSPRFTGLSTALSSSYGTEAAVRVRPGASMAAFLAAADSLRRHYLGPGGGTDVINLSDEVAATQQAIRPDAIALAVFAALAGLFALAVIGQLLGRQLILDATEFPILRALGMTRARLVGLSLARVGVVTLAGGALAVAVAVAASPLMPIGPARLAEPQPGVEVNLALLGAGFAAIALLPLAVLVPAAWRAAARVQGPQGVAEPAVPARASRLGPVLTRVGSVTGSVGVRMAFEPGRGRTAVPVRSALVGTTVAIAAVAAAVTFGTSLIALVGTPHRYGQNWAQELDLNFGGVTAGRGVKLLSAEPAISGYAAGDYGQLSIDGQLVAAIGINPVRGQGYFTLLTGHYPSGPGQIVLGAQTLRAIHRQLGQTVPVVANPVAAFGPARRQTMRIVGVAVFPEFGRGTFAATDLGTGAAVSAPMLSEPFPPTGCGARATCYNFFLLRYRPGTDLAAAASRLTAAVIKLGCLPGPGSCSVASDQRPSDIKNYASIRDTPLILGAVLALLAVATLAHALFTGVRRRRRDLAVLKTLGLRRSQVVRVVSWQASALAAAALLAGLPLGVLAGRWAWALFAGSAGVSDQAAIPAAPVLLAVPVVLVLANLIAAGPGWAAARISPAITLRSE